MNKLLHIKYIQLLKPTNFLLNYKYYFVINSNYIPNKYYLEIRNNLLIYKKGIYIPILKSKIITIKLYKDDLFTEDDLLKEYAINISNDKSIINETTKIIFTILNIMDEEMFEQNEERYVNLQNDYYNIKLEYNREISNKNDAINTINQLTEKLDILKKSEEAYIEKDRKMYQEFINLNQKYIDIKKSLEELKMYKNLMESKIREAFSVLN